MIRSAQIRAFEQSSREDFEAEMALHCKEYLSPLGKTIGDEQLRSAIQRAITEAEGHGFTHRGPARLYVDLTLLLGSGFDSDPQYPWAAALLASDELVEQVHRAEALHEKACEYLQQVGAPNPARARVALEQLATIERGDPALHPDGLLADARRLMEQAHPEKCAYTGDAPLQRLLSSARTDHGFKTSRSVLSLALLMFAFGHHCDQDPLYSWIGRALRDPDEPDPDLLARRLEREALRWFEAASKSELNGGDT